MARLTKSLFWLGLIGLLAVVLAGPAVRFGLLDWQVGLQLLGIAGLACGVIALAALIVGLVARAKRLPTRRIWLGGLMALAGFAVLGALYASGAKVPAIHDISTDTIDPPAFVAVVPLRTGALNPVDYAGEEVARQQHAAYPDIAPLNLDIAPDKAFDAAARAANGMGWDIVARVPEEGRIEAVATTTWFGFKDDVVVRVRARDAGGAVVDVRSKSRVGRSDLGANAKRIRAYLAAVRGNA